MIEILKRPDVAAEQEISAAEALGVDAAIIFADLLLPLEVMGLPFHFSPGEGPVIEKPVRDQADISRLRTDRAADLGYVAEAVRLVSKHFGARLPVIGFCGAPFTLASYMIEGGGSRHYVNTKKRVYSAPAAGGELLGKLVKVVAGCEGEEGGAGAEQLRGWKGGEGAGEKEMRADERKGADRQTNEIEAGHGDIENLTFAAEQI